MTVYGPDISDALGEYATQFDDLKVQERKPIIDLNAINPLSTLRETWQNTTTTPTEHKLSTTAGADDTAYLYTDARGQYTSGYQSQFGLGTRIPTYPSNDEVIRFGYFTTDTNEDPVNGWAFGVDSTGIFVAEYRNGTAKQKVYQENWNVDIADGSDTAEENPSGFDLDLSKGHIYQTEFVYYGYGPVKMTVLTDEGKVTLHKFTHEGSTSIENTNLPLSISIKSNGTNSDALDCYVGGRQFSVVGQRSVNKRHAAEYRGSLSGVDDAAWYPAISVKLKDATDIGSYDFRHVLGEPQDFIANPDNTQYRYQLRIGTTPNNPTWETPTSHTDTPGETAMKVDTTSTNITDGSGNLTGVFINGGEIAAGSNNASNVTETDSSGKIVGEQIVTLLFQAAPGETGTISDIQFKWIERW